MKNFLISQTLKGVRSLFVFLLIGSAVSTCAAGYYEVKGPELAQAVEGITDPTAKKFIEDAYAAGFKALGRDNGEAIYASKVGVLDVSDFYNDPATKDNGGFIRLTAKNSGHFTVIPKTGLLTHLPLNTRAMGLSKIGDHPICVDNSITGIQGVVCKYGQVFTGNSSYRERAWGRRHYGLEGVHWGGGHASSITVGNAFYLWKVCRDSEPAGRIEQVKNMYTRGARWDPVLVDGKEVFANQQVETVDGVQYFKAIAGSFDGALWFVNKATGSLEKLDCFGEHTTVALPDGVKGNICHVSVAGSSEINFLAIATKDGSAYLSTNNGPFTKLNLSGVVQISVGMRGTLAVIGKTTNPELGSKVLVRPGTGNGSLIPPAGQKQSSGELKYGASANILHVQSGKYISFQDMHYFSLPGVSQTKAHAVVPGPKDFRSRWIFFRKYEGAESSKVIGGTINDGAIANLVNQETDFGLAKDGSFASKNSNIWGLGPAHNIVIKKVNNDTFVMTDGVDQVITLKGDKFGYDTNAQAVENPSNFAQYHFKAVDMDPAYGEQLISKIINGLNDLSEKGTNVVGGTSSIINYFDLGMRQVPGNDSKRILAAKTGHIFKINSDNYPVNHRNQILGFFKNALDRHRRTYTRADSIARSDDRFMLVDHNSLNRNPDTQFFEKKDGDAFTQPQTIKASEVSASGKHTILVTSSTDRKILLRTFDESGAGGFEFVQTPFQVLDACVVEDGTIWCVSTEGFVHRIDAGTFSYDDSNPDTRDVAGRNISSKPPWNKSEEFKVPGNVKVRAFGTAENYVLAVLNSKGEVFFSENGGEFESLGVQGILDLSFRADGFMALVSAVRPNKTSGFAMYGNYYLATDQESIKLMVEAKSTAARIGSYTGYLDIPILISQAGNFFGIEEDNLVAKETEPDTSKSFKFKKSSPDCYTISYGNRPLIVVENEDGTAQLTLGKAPEDSDEDDFEASTVFVVYGNQAANQVRVRYKNLFLGRQSDGSVGLSTRETFLKFEASSKYQLNKGQEALAEIERLNSELESAQDAAIDEAVQEVAELQQKLINEKLEDEKAKIETEIEALKIKTDEMEGRKDAAATLKAEMQAKLDEIEAERVSQENQIKERISELEAQLEAESDPVKKTEIQKQIDALQGSRESLADVLMQNAKTLSAQKIQEAKLLAQKAQLEKEIADIQAGARRKAEMAKEAFSGDINKMIMSIANGTHEKVAAALLMTVTELEAVLPEGETFPHQNIDELATAIGKDLEQLKSRLKSVYVKESEEEAFQLLKSDFERVSALKQIDTDTVVQAFKQDLGRFGQALGKSFDEITEAMSYGFNNLIKNEITPKKIQRLETLLSEQTSDIEKNIILTELFTLDPDREGTAPEPTSASQDLPTPTSLQAISDIHQETTAEINSKIETAFTETPKVLGTAWDISRDMLSQIVNYDILKEKYQKELEDLNAQRDALKAKLSTAIDENERLRAKLRTFMDDRAVQQKEIDEKITDLRRKMVAATTAADMETFVAQVKALKSSNDEIMDQLRENDIKIYENSKVIMKQETQAKVLEQVVEEVKAAQDLLMQEAVKDKRAIEKEIESAIDEYTKGDEAYQSQLETINAMPTGTAEGIASQQKKLAELQGKYFVDKKAALNGLQALNTKFIASIEKVKSVLTENVSELEGKKRIITQAYNEAIANLQLDNKEIDPKIMAAEKASYDEKIKPVDEKIDELKRIIDSKEGEIRAIQKDNMDRLKTLNDQIREASAAQVEAMRYQMLSQGDEERKEAQERIKRIEADNAKMLQDVNAVYEATKAKLQANADKVKEANEARKAELAASLESHKNRYADHQNQLNEMIANMIAKGKMAAEQQEMFDAWREKIKNAVDTKSNDIKMASAGFAEKANNSPSNFDQNIAAALMHDMKESLPGIPKLLDIIGLKTELSVREELVRETAIKDFQAQIDGQNLGAGNVAVIGFTAGGADQTYGYLEKDADLLIVRDQISILNNVRLKIVKRSDTAISIELPDGKMRMTLGDDGSLNLAAAINAESADGAIGPDSRQLFDIEHQSDGEFLLSNSGQYLTVSGEVTSASTQDSARLTLGDKGSAVKFITFKMLSSEFDEEFNILKSELPKKFETFKANLSPTEFKSKIGKFKAALAEGFASIDGVKENFVTQITTIMGEEELQDLSDLEQTEKTKIETSSTADLLDPETSGSLQGLLDSNTDLNDKTKKAVQELLNEGKRQVELVGRIAKEQNYRVVELRKTYLETTVEKNQQIGFLEADSRWQKFQWARDIYLLIQLQLDASERDRIEFEKELKAASDKFDKKRDELTAERDKTVDNLKDTLQKKIEASQRASEELKALSEEKEQIFKDHLAQMQKDMDSLNAEERAKRDQRINMLMEEHNAMTKDINEKYTQQIKMIQLDQERVEALGAMKVSILERKILNAQQYLISFKIESGTEVVLSNKSDNTGEIRYIRQGKFDDLEVSTGIRFDDSARLKMVAQQDATFSLETVDGGKRITLVGDNEVDLMDAVNVESSVKGEEGKMVADENQVFFAEGSQAEGVVFRDKQKRGYITIKETLSDPAVPQSKKINILTFTTSAAALNQTVSGNNASPETRFQVIKFSEGSGTIEELLSQFYSDQNSEASDQAIAAAEEFFNNNRLYNYPHRMDNFIQAVSEFGQGRVNTGLMTESALEATNELIYQINESFNFAVNEEGSVVSSASQIKLLDQDYVEPILMKEGQIVVITYNGKHLSRNSVVDENGNPTIQFVDGNLFDRALSLKVVESAKKNTVSLIDMDGKKRLSFEGGIVQWTDASEAISNNDLFTFSGTRHTASIIAQGVALTAFQPILKDENGQIIIGDDNRPKGSGEITLGTTDSMDTAVAFKINVFHPGSFESMLVNQGLAKYGQNPESKKAIETITDKLIDIIGGSDFDQSEKNAFINSFATYLEAYVSPESMSMWANAVKRISYSAKQSMSKVDPAVMGKLSSTVKEFQIESGAYLVLKNLQENKYLAVDENRRSIAKESKEPTAEMLFRVVRKGDKYALVARDGKGGYLTSTDAGVIESKSQPLSADGTVSTQPEPNQLFWLIGYGTQVGLKLGQTNIQDEEGFLAIHPNLQLTSWNFDNPQDKPKYKITASRTKFEAQVLDEYSLIRGIINDGADGITGNLLEGLMAIRENPNMTDEQKSLSAQQKLKDFEEFVLAKEVLPAEEEGGDPIITYALKPEFEPLRQLQTDESAGVFSLKDTIEYIDKYVFYDPIAKAGIKLGKVGDTIFRAMKEGFSQFRLLQKDLSQETINSLINPGGYEIEFDEKGNPVEDYIGKYLDSLMGDDLDPVKVSPILYGYVLNLARTLYPPEYKDNSVRFQINENGQLVDINGTLYTFDSSGKFKSRTGQEFTDFADPITDPDGRLLAEAEQFNPGVILTVSEEQTTVMMEIPSSGSMEDLENLKAEIMASAELSENKKTAIVNMFNSIAAAGGQTLNFGPVIQIVEAFKKNVYLSFGKSNRGKKFIADSQLSAEFKDKVNRALNKFIDGGSMILTRVENGKDFLSAMQGSTLTSPFSQLKERLIKEFKFASGFKEEDLSSMVRQISYRSEHETNQWRREMLVELMEFVGTKAWFEKLEDGTFELNMEEGASSPIYDNQDIKDLIEKIRNQLMEVVLAEGQISLNQKYEMIMNKAMELYFNGSYDKSIKLLTQFEDDNKPKDWTSDDSPYEWFENVRPMPGDGSEKTKRKNQHERSKAWSDKRPLYLTRLLTSEQQTMRMNLLTYAKKAAKKAARRTSRKRR